MYCRYCGQSVDPKAEFCDHCGRRLRSALAVFLERAEWTRLRLPDTPRSPGTAGALGFCLGWVFAGPFGYIYLGQWNWVWLSFFVEIVALAIGHGVAYALLPFLFGFHQYDMAREINRRLDEARRERGDDRGAGAPTP